MSKKAIIVLAVALLALVGWGARVYYVNAGVATTYDLDTFQISDEIQLDNATLTVVGFTYGKVKEENGYESVPVTVEMKVENSSDESVSARSLIETKLAYGRDYFQTRDGEFNINELGNLSPGGTTNVKLVYNVTAEYKGDNAKLYIAQGLYGQQAMEKYEDGERYGVVVKLAE